MHWLIRTWLPLAIVITGACGLVHVAVQQSLREGLNDPQIQMAEDGAAVLSHGGAPAEVVLRTSRMIDANASLAPWISVLDATGTSLESNAVLDGKPPVPPRGALDAARGSSGKDTTQPNENRITWQTASGTRIALVIVWVPDKERFVVAGRTMREVELREWQLGRMVGIAWVLMLAATLLATWLGARFTAQPGEAW